jgi:hypothetical protein
MQKMDRSELLAKFFGLLLPNPKKITSLGQFQMARNQESMEMFVLP